MTAVSASARFVTALTYMPPLCHTGAASAADQAGQSLGDLTAYRWKILSLLLTKNTTQRRRASR
jgi:hypothetical protein